MYRLLTSDVYYVQSERSSEIYYYVKYNPSVFEWCHVPITRQDIQSENTNLHQNMLSDWELLKTLRNCQQKQKDIVVQQQQQQQQQNHIEMMIMTSNILNEYKRQREENEICYKNNRGKRLITTMRVSIFSIFLKILQRLNICLECGYLKYVYNYIENSEL